MTKKRILLIHGDRLLQQFFQEAVEHDGFKVDTADSLDEAQLLISEQTPAAILLDPVPPAGRAVNFVKLLRADPATAQIPVLLLPCGLPELANSVLTVGATAFIERGTNVGASIIGALRKSLGLVQRLNGEVGSFYAKDDSWRGMIFSGALKAINEMRHCLPGLMSQPPSPLALRNLWHLVHSFAQKTLFLSNKPLQQFLEAMDLLMHDLSEAPDQINPSTLRTIGQAIDLLAVISAPEVMERLSEPTAARILVVDDEPGALQFISAALHLAGLKGDTADAPSVCLDKLNDGDWNLIFLDIGLPEADGFQLCTQIRTIEKLKTVPIVFITGMASFANKATACLSGGNDFVGKPFNLCELGVKALTWLFRAQLGKS